MKKGILVFVCFSIFGMASAKAKGDDDVNKRFDRYKANFVQGLWKMYPTWASSVGFHKYDNVLLLPDQTFRNKERIFCNGNLDSLKDFKLSQLSDVNKTDYHLIENQMKYAIWNLDELKAWQWDPSMYNVSGVFADMLGNDYDALDTRLRNFYVRMAAVPGYYSVAKWNVGSPTKEHLELAIEQNQGGISVFEDDLEAALKKCTLPEKEQADIRARAKETVESIKAYIQWLKEYQNRHPHSFRLGKELYQQKFAFEIQSGYSADEIYKKAIAHKAELTDKMYEITKQLWPKYLQAATMPDSKPKAIKMMIDVLSNNHVKPDSFQSAIEHQLPALVEFIKAKNLIYIDPSKPLVVRKEPAYMAGVAGASVNSPGPYDKNGNTYYNVGSLAGWPPEKAESYLREYNHYILQILNIHEAIPGHYTQLVYANQSPSIIKSILGNNAMIEGWAVYAERMMLESGYDGDKGVTSTEASPEMWLMYYKWNLRSTCNTILDYSVHTRNMQKEEAINMLVNEAFQQQAEAEGKWKRVSVTQVQLCCYFTGYTEIYDFREEMKEKMKGKFDLKKFHEQFLSYGSAPVKYIRELMEEE